MKEAARQYVFEYLSEHPCVDCDETDVVVLEFDHKTGMKTGGSSNTVCKMMNGSHTVEELATEIKKCEVRCANCHRRKTANANGNWKIALIAQLD